MKAIKFRAWDKDAGRWALADDFPIGTELHEFSIEASWLELEQFTGLLDKNGKPVFEGDIIIEGGNTAEVFWDQPFARWAYRTRTGTAGMYLFIGEVIGNIHENPEALK